MRRLTIRSSAEAALDKELTLVEGTSPFGDRGVPDKAASLNILKDMLSLGSAKDVDATDEELRIFGKICLLLSQRRKKWLMATHSTLPHGPPGKQEAAVKRFATRVAIPADCTPPREADVDSTAELLGRKELICKLRSFVPDEELAQFSAILDFHDASSDSSGRRIDCLPGVADVSGVLVLRGVQEFCYRLAHDAPFSPPLEWDGALPGLLAAAQKEKLSACETELQHHKTRWHKISAQFNRGDSLFSRLLVNISINRFLRDEVSISRHAKDALEIQLGLVRELEDGGQARVVEHIEIFTSGGQVDCHSLSRALLAASAARSGRSISTGVAKIIERQVELIQNSCYLKEFSGESSNSHILRSEAKVLAWLALAWAFLNKAKVSNEDPLIKSKRVLLISERSHPHSHGQGMILRRRLVSSLVVTRQLHCISAASVLGQHVYSSGIRRLANDAVTTVLRRASLAGWLAISEDLKRFI